MSPPDVFHNVPASKEDSNSQVQLSDSPDNPRLQRDLAILADLESGEKYRAIAARHDVSLGLISALATKMRVYKGVTRNYMIAKALEVADDWLDASREAAKRGDHRPAKDWLLHAQEIEPIADSPKMGIQINVGNGSAPMQDVSGLPTITVQPQPAQSLTDE